MPVTAPIPITGHTGLIALLGSPVSHSLSPLMHNEAFRLLGLDLVYLCFDVTEETLEEAVTGLKRCSIRGFNLTMPNKNRILPLLDTLSPAARLIGAVNTVVNENGRLTGHNTDGLGFVSALGEEGIAVEGRTVTLLGAGGAATAIVTQLALDGAGPIHVLFRPESRFAPRMYALKEQLEKETGATLCLESMDALEEALAGSSLLINATNVGMAAQEGQSLVPASLLRRDLFVADVIYNPRQTRLLLDAREAGCRSMNGLGMLLHQGAAAFRLWTGQEMPLEAIREKFFQ